MKMINKMMLGMALLGLFSLTACEVSEGPGGLATIEGKVYAYDYNGGFSELQEEYYAPEVDVYLVYGDEPVYGDDMKTHHDGSFSFSYLRKGTYTIYTYSKDSTGNVASGVIPVSQTFEITDKKEVVVADDLEIIQ